MTRLTSSLFCYLLASTHYCVNTTCAPVNHLPDTSGRLSSHSVHNLIYADFHPDLRTVNLAADLISQPSRNFNFRHCTEKEYHRWYTKIYLFVCQHRFSTATNTLKDLLAIYCDQYCGHIYLSHLMRCGPTALKMAEHYRTLCSYFR